jgi:hypothetical protein
MSFKNVGYLIMSTVLFILKYLSGVPDYFPDGYSSGTLY